MAFSAVRSGVNPAAASCLALSGASAHDQIAASPKSAFLSGAVPRSGILLQEKQVVAQSAPQRSARQGRRSGVIRAVAAGPRTIEDGKIRLESALEADQEALSCIKSSWIQICLLFERSYSYRAEAQKVCQCRLLQGCNIASL